MLRGFEARQKANPSYNFVTYLRDELKMALENDEQLTTAFLQNILAIGGAFLVFDGLDEVLDVGARRDTVNQIEQFAALYATCPILVTSRLVGYRDAPISEAFQPYGLARFNVEEVRSYSTKSIRAILSCSLLEAGSKAGDFVRQTNKIGGDLRENPLMLGLMVHIFVNHGEVPSNRPEIYKECASLMFEKWDGRRDIVVKDVPRADIELLDVFGYVASRVFGDASNEEGVSKEWLTGELRKHFEAWYIDRASASRAAFSLVDFLIGRAWVMSEVGSGVFKFTHRTFLEYFFSRNVISQSRNMEELIESKLLPRVINNEWSVISHLALHMAVFRDGGKGRQAADVLIKSIEAGEKSPEQELALLEFVAGTFDYLIIAETLYVRMVALLLKRAIALGGEGYTNAVSVFWGILDHTKGRDKLAKETVERVIREYLRSRSRSEFLFCASVLGSRHWITRGDSRRVRIRGEPVLFLNSGGHPLNSLRGEFRKPLAEMAKRDIEAARAYILVYEELRVFFYESHGTKILRGPIKSVSPIGGYDVLLDTIESVASALRHATRGGVPIDDDQRGFIEAVANDIVSGKLNRADVSSDRARMSNGESIIDDAFQSLWMSKRRLQSWQSKKAAANYNGVMSVCLICVFFVASCLNHAGRGSGQRRVSIARGKSIRDLLSSIQGADNSAKLGELASEFLRSTS